MKPLYFCSGASAPSDLRGLARIRHPLGVSIPQLSGPALDYLCTLRGIAPVFVDTEAFSEVDREGRVVAPITDAAWIDRTRVMHRIAASLGADAWIVAPDRVGDQQETLRRLARFEDVLRAIVALGARLVVPIQRGGMSATLFHDAAAAIVGGPFVCGIPGNKAAMPAGELEDFLRARRPRAVHLLGVGPKSPRFHALVDVLRRFVPTAEVSCDSNGLAALVGKTNGRGGAPRALTAWQEQTGEREGAVIMAIGPKLFYDRAIAAYREAGLVATRERPLQPGLFDAVEKEKRRAG